MKKQILFLTILLCSGTLFATDNAGSGGTGDGPRRNIHRLQPNTGPGARPLQMPPGWGPQSAAIFTPAQGARTSRQKQLDSTVRKVRGHFFSWPYLALEYASDMINAAALRTRNPHLMRILYMLSTTTKGVNGAAALTDAVAPLTPSLGYTHPYERSSRQIFYRIIAGLAAASDISSAAESGKMVANAGKLAHLYRRNPQLRKTLNKTSSKRFNNKTIAMVLALLSWPILRGLFKTSADNKIEPVIALCIYHIASMSLDRKGINHGLEKELIARAQKLSTGRKQQAGVGIKETKKKKKKPNDRVGKPPKIEFAEMTDEELEELLKNAQGSSEE